MTGTYTMGWPWLRSAASCGPDARALEDWWVRMTAGGARRLGEPFTSWRRWEGPPPGGPWARGPWARGPWARGPRTPKARRGDVRAAVLGVLADRSVNGYQIIQEIAERTCGAWKPSPGSIYPTLQQLEDEGLVRAEEDAGRRTYSLTDEGRRYVAEHPDEIAAPWQSLEEPDEVAEGLKPLIGQVAGAVWQIIAVGTPEQKARGREALIDMRRKLDAILADDDTEERR